MVPISTSLRHCFWRHAMVDGVVLVTGAAGGTQGQTGRHVCEMLLARGTSVRAFVRKLDERAGRLRALGADVVEGDFLDYHSLDRAAQRATTLSFPYPPH